LKNSPLTEDVKTKIVNLIHTSHGPQLIQVLTIWCGATNPQMKFSATLFRGLIEFYSGQFGRAQQDFDSLIQFFHSDPEKLFVLYICCGLCAKQQQSFELAIQWFQKALSIQGKENDWELLKNLAECSKRVAKPDQTMMLNFIQRAYNLNANNILILLERADIFIMCKKFKEAMADVEAGFALRSRKQDRLFFLKGRILRDMKESKDLNAAINCFNNAIELNPNFWEARLHRADSKREIGQTVEKEKQVESEKLIAEALREVEFVLNEIQNNSNQADLLVFAYSVRAKIYFLQNKMEMSLNDYNRAINLNPTPSLSYSRMQVLDSLSSGLLERKERKREREIYYYND